MGSQKCLVPRAEVVIEAHHVLVVDGGEIRLPRLIGMDGELQQAEHQIGELLLNGTVSTWEDTVIGGNASEL